MDSSNAPLAASTSRWALCSTSNAMTSPCLSAPRKSWYDSRIRFSRWIWSWAEVVTSRYVRLIFSKRSAMSPRVTFIHTFDSRSNVEILPSSTWSTIALASSRMLSKDSAIFSYRVPISIACTCCRTTSLKSDACARVRVMARTRSGSSSWICCNSATIGASWVAGAVGIRFRSRRRDIARSR